MKKQLLLCLLFLLHLSGYAQKEKFGKYNSNEISYSEVDFEPDAEAVVLSRKGFPNSSGKFLKQPTISGSKF
ncbi:MAG: hypothetical protein CL555_11715 [Algoriphagus sp.]|nr:hypothetical protein [Algoriphagus sp.]